MSANTPLSKPIAQLKKMSEKRLFSYFTTHARFMPDAPANSKHRYVIYVGMKLLHSGDTHELRQQFEKVVKEAVVKETTKTKGPRKTVKK